MEIKPDPGELFEDDHLITEPTDKLVDDQLSDLNKGTLAESNESFPAAKNTMQTDIPHKRTEGYVAIEQNECKNEYMAEKVEDIFEAFNQDLQPDVPISTIKEEEDIESSALDEDQLIFSSRQEDNHYNEEEYDEKPLFEVRGYPVWQEGPKPLITNIMSEEHTQSDSPTALMKTFEKEIFLSDRQHYVHNYKRNLTTKDPVSISKLRYKKKIASSTDYTLPESQLNVNDIIKCEICEKEFKKESNLTVHKQKVHKVRENYFCYVCGKEHSCKSFLVRHLTTHSNERNITCDHCGNTYKSERSLKTHLKTLTERHYCEECGKGFANKSYVAKHAKRFHSTDSIDRIECEECGKRFYTNKVLASHIKVVHGLKSTTTYCDVCLKRCSTKRAMQQHFARFHMMQTFTCGDCSAVFTNKDYLRNHIQLKHLPPTYKCAVCFKMHLSYQSLGVHLRSVHNIDNRKKFKCTVCEKLFKDNCRLVRHQRIHNNEKPFVCEVCGKCFRSESNLSQHTRTHSNVRPYTCGACDKAFRIKHHLRQHMAVHGMASVPKYGKRGKNQGRQ